MLQLHGLSGATPEGAGQGEKGGPYLLHTLNGTVVAVGRTIIAIMENYQTDDGRVDTPTVLSPFLPEGKEVLEG